MFCLLCCLCYVLFPGSESFWYVCIGSDHGAGLPTDFYCSLNRPLPRISRVSIKDVRRALVRSSVRCAIFTAVLIQRTASRRTYAPTRPFLDRRLCIARRARPSPLEWTVTALDCGSVQQSDGEVKQHNLDHLYAFHSASASAKSCSQRLCHRRISSRSCYS